MESTEGANIRRRLIKTVKSIDFAPERHMNVKSLGNVEIFEVVLDDGKIINQNIKEEN